MNFKKLLLIALVPLILLHSNGMVVHIHQCVKHICEQACCDTKADQKISCCKSDRFEDEDSCCKNEKKYVKADDAQIISGEKKCITEKLWDAPLFVTTYTFKSYLNIESTFISTVQLYVQPPPFDPTEFRSVIQVWNC